MKRKKFSLLKKIKFNILKKIFIMSNFVEIVDHKFYNIKN